MTKHSDLRFTATQAAKATKVSDYKCFDCGDEWTYFRKGRPPETCEICGGNLELMATREVDRAY